MTKPNQKKNQTTQEIGYLSQVKSQELYLLDKADAIGEDYRKTYLTTSKGARLINELMVSVDKGDTTKGNNPDKMRNLLTWKSRSESIRKQAKDEKQISIFDYVGDPDSPSIAVSDITDRTGTLVAITDTSSFSRKNSASRKFLGVIFSEALKVSQTTGGKVGPVIVPYEVFVESGAYKEARYVKENFQKQYPLLRTLEIIAVDSNGKTTIDLIKKDLQEELTKRTSKSRSLIIGADFNSDHAVIYLNPYINYTALFRHYTIFPVEALGAKGKGYDLFVSIFTNARQRHKQIKAEGYFNLSLMTVCRDLGLPDIEDNANPGRTIIEPIEKAITEVEDLVKKASTEKGLTESYMTITPHGFEEESHKLKIEKGYLEISFKGEYLEYYTDLANSQRKEIEKMKRIADKKQERIDKAIAEKIAEGKQ